MTTQRYESDFKTKKHLNLKIDIPKEEVVGSYSHPALRRMRCFYYFHGQEFLQAVNQIYKHGSLDFDFIVLVTREFVAQRLRRIIHVRGKSKAVSMYHNAILNFNLLFCRDLYAIIQHKDDMYKFERLENFMSYIYDPSIRCLKDVTTKAFLQ